MQEESTSHVMLCYVMSDNVSSIFNSRVPNDHNDHYFLLCCVTPIHDTRTNKNNEQKCDARVHNIYSTAIYRPFHSSDNNDNSILFQWSFSA